MDAVVSRQRSVSRGEASRYTVGDLVQVASGHILGEVIDIDRRHNGVLVRFDPKTSHAQGAWFAPGELRRRKPPRVLPA